MLKILYKNKIKFLKFLTMGIGDWGLGIGAQSPIPNPQKKAKFKF